MDVQRRLVIIQTVPFRAFRSMLCPGKTASFRVADLVWLQPLMSAKCSLSVSCHLTNGDNTHPMKFLEANEGRSGKHLMSPHTRAVHHGFQTGYFRPGVGKLTVNEQKIKFLLLLQKPIQQKFSIRKCTWPNFYIALKRALREDTEAWISLVYIPVLLFILSGRLLPWWYSFLLLSSLQCCSVAHGLLLPQPHPSQHSRRARVTVFLRHSCYHLISMITSWPWIFPTPMRVSLASSKIPSKKVFYTFRHTVSIQLQV